MTRRSAVLSTLKTQTETFRNKTTARQTGHHHNSPVLSAAVELWRERKIHSHRRLRDAYYTKHEANLPEMQLVLVGLLDGGQCVEMTEELHPVVDLCVVQTVAEHLQQGVKDPQRLVFNHSR